MNTGTLKKKYLARLTRLIRTHDENRRERFIPFLLILQKKRRHSRFAEALAIVRYFLDNAILFTKEDEEFHRVLSEEMKLEDLPDYFEYARKTPYPLADYLKVIYDLRKGQGDYVGTAIKQDMIDQIQELMAQQFLTKTALAERMNTSRASLDRLLDPGTSVTLQTLQKAADALNCKISLRLVS